MTTFPARLHVLLAKDALTGVVLRRGPHQRVCTVGWDRATDTFSTGQWLKGRIDERLSDISPDGRHLIYHATNGKWQSEMAAWTAISRAPYLKAVGLWTGGYRGLFLDDRTYWLNGWGGEMVVREPGGFRETEEFPHADLFGRKNPASYFLRLTRDGWVHNPNLRLGPASDAVFDKRVHAGWVLRKYALSSYGRNNNDRLQGKGGTYDRHQLFHPDTGESVNGAEWGWADLDRERLVWATGGKLFAADLTPEGLTNARELHDFNAMKFEPLVAPY